MFDKLQNELDSLPYVGSVCEDSFSSVRLSLLANSRVRVCTLLEGKHSNNNQFTDRARHSHGYSN